MHQSPARQLPLAGVGSRLYGLVYALISGLIYGLVWLWPGLVMAWAGRTPAALDGDRAKPSQARPVLGTILARSCSSRISPPAGGTQPAPETAELRVNGWTHPAQHLGGHL